MQAMTPITPLEPGVEMFERGKAQSFFSNALTARSSLERPLSHISVAYTDIEDDSSEFEEFEEEFSGSSSENRRSQTTISTFEEVRTPSEEVRPQFAYWPEQKSVEGPKGPHLFRASQSSNDFAYDTVMQMSPLLPKETSFRQPTAFRETTPATIVPQREYNNIAFAVSHLDNAEVRAWTSQDVATWMYQNGFEDEVINKFMEHDITGGVLLDLQFEHLKELEIQSFGKRHQLWNQIDALRTADGLMSPTAPAAIPTPFEDVERPCQEARNNRSKSKGRKASRRDKSRGRNLGDDLITPAHSVSIVAIEQLLPKPHVCAKGERCRKWIKQKKQLAKLQQEHGFPISPEKGGHIFIAGDPGNPQTAPHAVENVHRPNSEATPSVVVPSVVASSDVLGPGQMPEFSLDDLQKFEQRDPQDNVRQFLTLQGQQQPFTSATPIEAPPTPPTESYPPRPFLVIPQHQPYPQVSAFSASTSAHTTKSFDPFTQTPQTPALHPPEFMPAPHSNLKSLPKLTIPPARSMSAQPAGNPRSGIPANHYLAPDTAFSPCRTASPSGVYRFGTPFSEMDVPVTAVQPEPLSRDTSQSVPPNMQYQPQIQRAGSRHDRRRPSLPMPVLAEDRVFSPTAHSDDDTLRGTIFDDSVSTSNSVSSSPLKAPKALESEAGDTIAPLPKGGFQYKGVNHHGWMKKRRTKLLRHEWQDHHFRLQGTTLAMHPNELPSSSALQTIDVDDYAVACSSLASNKLSAKFRALKLSSGHHKEKTAASAPAFEFQLVPTVPEKGDFKKVMPNGKVQHFAVTTKDQRIEWMRELMLAKALKAKNDGYEVNVNGANM